MQEQKTTEAWDIARVAQLVEHTLGKGEVIGSIPIASSESYWLLAIGTSVTGDSVNGGGAKATLAGKGRGSSRS